MAGNFYTRAQELLMAVVTAAKASWATGDDNPVEVWKSLPEGEFAQPGQIVVIGRPKLKLRQHNGPTHVWLTLDVPMMAIVPWKPHEDGRQAGLEAAELLRDRVVAAIEAQTGCGLTQLGALSNLHGWTFGDLGDVLGEGGEPMGNNLLGADFMMTVGMSRSRNVIEAPDPPAGP